MPKADELTVAGTRVSYLRGVLDSEKLSPDERQELALSTFVEVSERLIELLTEIRNEQTEIRRILAELRNGTAHDGQSIPQGDHMRCPQCGERLSIGPEAIDRGPAEVTCPRCHLILEVA